MKAEFIEKIYAGWLAKIIGIRYGAPIEGWTYEKIFTENWIIIQWIIMSLRQMMTATALCFS